MILNLSYLPWRKYKKKMTEKKLNLNEWPNLGPLLNNIVYKNLHSILFTIWLIGFTDGEGTFYVEINKNPTMKTGSQVQVSYILTQHGRDLELLENIKKFFNDNGEIKLNRGVNGGNIYQYRLRHFEMVKTYIIPLFSNLTARKNSSLWLPFSIKNKKKIRF